MANICHHGCPECISIGSKCHLGSFYEKYGINKIVLDELLRNILQEATLDDFNKDQVLQLLEKYDYAVVKGAFDKYNSYEDMLKKMDSSVLELSGIGSTKGHIKYSGHWPYLDSFNNTLYYYYLLRVV